MLIDFSPSGRVQFTRNPALLMLFPDDQKNIVRMTDIQFCILSQRFYIQFLTGEFATLILRWKGAGLERADRLAELWRDFADEHSPMLVGEVLGNQWREGQVLFASYEDAVKVEVEFIDFLREQGIAVQ